MINYQVLWKLRCASWSGLTAERASLRSSGQAPLSSGASPSTHLVSQAHTGSNRTLIKCLISFKITELIDPHYQKQKMCKSRNGESMMSCNSVSHRPSVTVWNHIPRPFSHTQIRFFYSPKKQSACISCIVTCLFYFVIYHGRFSLLINKLLLVFSKPSLYNFLS